MLHSALRSNPVGKLGWVLSPALVAPLRLAGRASAGARARSSASVSDVWAVLSHPDRWAEFDPFLESVSKSVIKPGSQRSPESAWQALSADLAETGELTVAEGQLLAARLRLVPLELGVQVDHVVNRSTLAVTTALLPGLTEELEHLVIPTATGGALVTARFTLHGPLALPALLPRWVLRLLTVRLLARAAEAPLRERAEDVSSVA